MPSPASIALTETRGDTWSFIVNLQDETTGLPINISGRTYSMQVRSSSESSTIKASYTCTVTDAANGRIECVCSPTVTATLKIGQYVWDFQQNISGSLATLFTGTLNVLGDVTR